MDRAHFLTLSEREVAVQLQQRTEPCWAIAMGGTRRAYIAEGGSLDRPQDAAAYLDWVEAAHCALLDQVFRLGVQTIISVVRLPADRGPSYDALVRVGLDRLARAEPRRELYQRHQLCVAVGGDLDRLGTELAAPGLIAELRDLAATTASAAGPRLIYLFRSGWIDAAVEEARLGFVVGTRLGRAPTLAELIDAYYGMQVAPLTLYLGSGRPQLADLRPPLLGGAEDLYWAQTPLTRLQPQDWRHIIFDHLWSRRTDSAREYTLNATSRAALAAALAARDGQILGVGTQHPLGFWLADDFMVSRV